MAQRVTWYGVKTLYRWEPVGRPLGIDRHYSSDVTLAEERVVVVRARNADEAIRKAEREARRYSAKSYRNPYGQWVRTRSLGHLDAYELVYPPSDGAEVFSETEVVSRTQSDRSVISRLIGRPQPSRIRASRRNILDIVFAGHALGVTPTRAERALRKTFTSGRKR